MDDLEKELESLHRITIKLRDSIVHKNTGTISLCSTILCKISMIKLLVHKLKEKAK